MHLSIRRFWHKLVQTDVRRSSRQRPSHVKSPAPRADQIESLAGLPFIFIIGFNKTATKSLHAFFAGNGFPSVHWDKGKLARRMVEDCLDDRPILDGYDARFRVFSDMQAQSSRIRIEANQFFRILDRDYPGAYFIFNNRNLDDWIRSRSANFVTPHGATNLELEMRRLNTTDPNEAVLVWTRERRTFEEDVRHYFRNHPRFLEIDIIDPELPQRIARFIDRSLDAGQWRHIRTN